MTRQDILVELHEALVARNPTLAFQLRPPLSRESLEEQLAPLPGDKSGLLDLYSWHGGTEPLRYKDGARHVMSYAELSLAPEELLILFPIDLMLSHRDMWAQMKRHHRDFQSASLHCYPFLWDGDTTWLGLDLRDQYAGRVLVVEFQSDRPVREAYPSLDDLLRDLIRVNRTGGLLKYS